ncbi:MAG: hypothetical protein IJF33_00415 [Clostridia bacterium]|nr:hypothetical protein [Clostridia bacterium]
MLKITERQMFLFLRESYPAVDKGALLDMAREKIDTLEEVFEPIVLRYLAEKRPIEFEHGEFSLSYIMALCGCAYPQAVLLMDAYIKDPEKGKYSILRR